MAKINFTKEHLAKLQGMAITALFANLSITTKMGTPLNISELLHTTTIGTLNEIKVGLAKRIVKLEIADEWVETSENQQKMDEAKFQKELVNLVIGYKRFILKRESREAERKKLTEELKALKESQKTPEDRIKEMEAQLQELEEEDFK